MAEKENKFSKSDMERVGVFQEMGYITIQDRYKGGGSTSFNAAASKGKQMLPGGSKGRSALQAGYFNEKFHRVMEGEAYSDPIKIRRQHRLKEGQKNLSKPFLPSNGEKKPSGLGSFYGTLTGPIGAFSPTNKPKKAYKVPGKNFYTNPGKRGTGFGYVSVTIGQYQKHEADNYDRAKDNLRKEMDAHKNSIKGGAFKLNMHPRTYFDENPYRSDRPSRPGAREAERPKDVKPFKPSSPGKKPAGSKAGTFDAYPSHSVDPYKVKNGRPVHVVNKTGKTFMPSAGPKSAPVNSVLNQNVVKEVNNQNYKQITAIMAY